MRAAALRAGRSEDAATLVAVTKYAPIEAVRELLNSGLAAEIGENRVMDAEKKKNALGDLAGKVKWRLIGHLQSNKAKKAAALFDSVDTVDSVKIAEALQSAAQSLGKILPVMIQVKLSEKETQGGISPESLPQVVAAVRGCSALTLEGLFAIAPNLEPVEAVRPSFRLLRRLRDEHVRGGKLSMGMSRDFEIAIEEGADMVRIGTQIFSSNSQASLEAQA